MKNRYFAFGTLGNIAGKGKVSYISLKHTVGKIKQPLAPSTRTFL